MNIVYRVLSRLQPVGQNLVVADSFEEAQEWAEGREFYFIHDFSTLYLYNNRSHVWWRAKRSIMEDERLRMIYVHAKRRGMSVGGQVNVAMPESERSQTTYEIVRTSPDGPGISLVVEKLPW